MTHVGQPCKEEPIANVSGRRLGTEHMTGLRGHPRSLVGIVNQDYLRGKRLCAWDNSAWAAVAQEVEQVGQ